MWAWCWGRGHGVGPVPLQLQLTPTHPPHPLPPPCHRPQVHVEPGHRHGSKVVFRGEAGSDSPDVLPGDLIFILEQASARARAWACLDTGVPVCSVLLAAWRRHSRLAWAPARQPARHPIQVLTSHRPPPPPPSAEGARRLQAHRD